MTSSVPGQIQSVITTSTLTYTTFEVFAYFYEQFHWEDAVIIFHASFIFLSCSQGNRRSTPGIRRSIYKQEQNELGNSQGQAGREA